MGDRGHDPRDGNRSVDLRTVSNATHRPTSAAGHRRIDFDNPPVVETLLGVQFVPLRGLSLPYIGLYWGEVRTAYPSQEVKPPLVPEIEEFPASPLTQRVSVQVTSEPDARCWFIDSTSTQLIQIQRDRFVRNWRKGEPPNDAYPRYDRLRPRFESDWLNFLRFLERENLGQPEVNQCEVTYINHIELGAAWRSLGEPHEVLRILGSPGPREFLPEPEMVLLNARYAVPDGKGRLHITAQPAIRRQDAKEVMQLTLTARGRPSSSRLEDILAWFELGHDWIVHGFEDITTLKMHEIWGKR